MFEDDCNWFLCRNERIGYFGRHEFHGQAGFVVGDFRRARTTQFVVAFALPHHYLLSCSQIRRCGYVQREHLVHPPGALGGVQEPDGNVVTVHSRIFDAGASMVEHAEEIR